MNTSKLLKKLKTDYVYDPERQYAVIKCSICTGEKVAGFKNKTDGHFTEVMLIASPEDEATFMYAFGLDDVTVTSNSAQYNKSFGDLVKKMGMEDAWLNRS